MVQCHCPGLFANYLPSPSKIVVAVSFELLKVSFAVIQDYVCSSIDGTFCNMWAVSQIDELPVERVVVFIDIQLQWDANGSITF